MSDAPPKGWHHAPDLPIQVAPVFRRPFRAVDVVRWLWQSWFPVSEKLIILGLACVSYFWFQPSATVTATLSPDWIVGLYLRNLVLMVLVAGGLHLYLFTFRKQGNDLKFDTRALKTGGRSHSFRDQVRDNMFWTLASGVTIWTAFEVLMFWAMSNGYAPMLQWADNPVWFVALFVLIPLWENFWFYWIHRWLHMPAMYRRFHALHHRNTNISPWSGLSMHPVEHLIYLGSVLIHFVVAAHPLHIIFHLSYYALSAATSHAGFDGLRIGGRNRLQLGNYHHQLHHRYFECNYGSPAIPFDVWFGTWHDGTAQGHADMRQSRKNRMQANEVQMPKDGET